MSVDRPKLSLLKWFKNLLPRTLFARSLLIIVIPVLLLQVVTTLVFVDNHWRKVTSRLAFAVAGEIAIMANDIDQHHTEADIQNLSRKYAQKLDLLVTFEMGARLVPEVKSQGTWEPMTAQALSVALDKQVRLPYSLSFSQDDEWVNIGIQMDTGVLRVLALERRLFSTSAYIFLIWVMGSSLILFAIAVIFMRNQIRPIRKLALIAERMGKGQNVQAYKPEGAREIRQAGQAFLEMQERITRQIEQRTAMLAGISHDLRTPLTRLKLGLSLIGDNPDIEALKNDVTDMENMVNSYLDFVRGEGREFTSAVNLREFLEKSVENFKRHGTDISLDCASGVIVNVRPLLFTRCIQNIVQNADKYGTKIWIVVEQSGAQIFIHVDDNGPGINPELYDDVFRPFFRVDTSRNTNTGGVGLGLPIVRDIIHAHGGQVSLAKSAYGGLRVTLVLPI